MSDPSDISEPTTLAERLSARMARRARVGAGASLFGRLGLADPYVDQEEEDPADGGLFNFLTAARYYRALRSHRHRMMFRIGAIRHRAVAGERLRSAGPSFSRSRSLAGLALPSMNDVVLLDPTTSEDSEDETPVSRFRRPVRQARKPPVARAAERAEAPATDLMDALARIESMLRGAPRQQVQTVIREVEVLPVDQGNRRVERLLRDLPEPARTGPAGRAAQRQVRPTASTVAERRMTAEDAPGLRSVLRNSPMVNRLAASDGEEPHAVRPATRRRRVLGQVPEAVVLTTEDASEASEEGLRRRVRTVRPGAHASRSVAQSRRLAPPVPTARLASQVRRLAAPGAPAGSVRGVDASGARVPAPAAVGRPLRRALTGHLPEDSRSPVSSAPLRGVRERALPVSGRGVRRSPPGATAAVPRQTLVVPEGVPGEEASGQQQAVPARRAIRPAGPRRLGARSTVDERRDPTAPRSFGRKLPLAFSPAVSAGPPSSPADEPPEVATARLVRRAAQQATSSRARQSLSAPVALGRVSGTRRSTRSVWSHELDLLSPDSGPGADQAEGRRGRVALAGPRPSGAIGSAPASPVTDAVPEAKAAHVPGTRRALHRSVMQLPQVDDALLSAAPMGVARRPERAEHVLAHAVASDEPRRERAPLSPGVSTPEGPLTTEATPVDRALARDVRHVRVDERDRVRLATGGTDYLAVADELARVSRVTDVVPPDAVSLQPSMGTEDSLGPSGDRTGRRGGRPRPSRRAANRVAASPSEARDVRDWVLRPRHGSKANRRALPAAALQSMPVREVGTQPTSSVPGPSRASLTRELQRVATSFRAAERESLQVVRVEAVQRALGLATPSDVVGAGQPLERSALPVEWTLPQPVGPEGDEAADRPTGPAFVRGVGPNTHTEHAESRAAQATVGSLPGSPGDAAIARSARRSQEPIPQRSRPRPQPGPGDSAHRFTRPMLGVPIAQTMLQAGVVEQPESGQAPSVSTAPQRAVGVNGWARLATRTGEGFRRGAPEPQRGAPRGAIRSEASLTREAVEDVNAPSWVRRAVLPPPVAPVERPEPGSRLRSGSGLLMALSRASDPEEVLRVIVERRAEVPRLAAALPGPTATALRQVSSAAEAPEIQTLRAPTAAETSDEAPPTWRRRAGVRSSTRPSRTHLTRSGQTERSQGSQGIGSSGVMRLAGKLQKLIHLAEHERKLSEARQQVRMASEESRSEVESGVMGGGDAADAGVTLDELLEHVLTEVRRRQSIADQCTGETDGNQWW